MMIMLGMKKRKKEKWDELVIWGLVVKFCLHREKSLGMLHVSHSKTGRDLFTLSINEIFLFFFFLSSSNE